MSARNHPTILMCPPDYFAIEYEINPWMNRHQPSDHAEALKQWQALHQLLSSLGVQIELMTPVSGLPDLVFTANAGLVWNNIVFLSTFRHAARQGETVVDEEWFTAAGFETRKLPEPYAFEGAGDALFCGDTLYAGYMIRSEASAMHWLAGAMGCRVIPLQLIDSRFYHLDTCFCPLDSESAIYFPGAFDDYARKSLQQIPRLIPVEEAEAARFCCNAVVVGKNVVLNSGCPQLEAALISEGFQPHSTPLDEFLKSGGSAKCLTLRLDGEDTAIWT